MSLYSDRVRCTTNHAFLIITGVVFSALLGLLGFSINYTRVLHTGRLPLKFVYCTLYVRACGISFYIPNYCSLISKTHQSNHQSAYWMSSAWALPQMKKNMWNKWKNHFSEMKGDVGMSLHEKEGEQEDA